VAAIVLLTVTEPPVIDSVPTDEVLDALSVTEPPVVFKVAGDIVPAAPTLMPPPVTRTVPAPLIDPLIVVVVVRVKVRLAATGRLAAESTVSCPSDSGPPSALVVPVNVSADVVEPPAPVDVTPAAVTVPPVGAARADG
jgi:hypothetical protein